MKPNTDYYLYFGANNDISVLGYKTDGTYVGQYTGTAWDGLSGFYAKQNQIIHTGANICFLAMRIVSAYGTTYNHDICINFHYDGERDGEY